jgi:hypothetical protein
MKTLGLINTTALLLIALSLATPSGHADWRESAGQLLDNTIDASNKIFSSSEPEKKVEDGKKEKFYEIWEESLTILNQARDIYDQIPDAPDSTWIGTDKKSLRTDFNALLVEVIHLLDDGSMAEYRTVIGKLYRLIEKKKDKIQEYREARIIAPKKSMVKTTKAAYDEKIQDEEIEIDEINQEIQNINLTLGIKLRDIGIDLTDEQISVLLSRVDSDDIIQMTAVFDLLKLVTDQLLELTLNSNENITHARKYYGIHVVLLETVLFIQDQYISKLDEIYLPQLRKIIKDSVELKKDTRKRISSERDKNRKAIYKKNIAAQVLTIKTAELYSDMLNDQKDKVTRARRNAKKDLDLSINTYATVQISSELLSVLKESKNDLDALMTIQVPNIVPFENIEIQQKFEELSMKLSKN